MCSFSVFNFLITHLDYINFFLKFRGPDHTNHMMHNSFTFIHNLLHLTGEKTIQPFIDKENDVVCLFNGEIYNYKEFGNYKSDGCCLLDVYKKYGNNFVKKLDGEFALALFDFNKEIFIISTDVFATKPLWYAFNEETEKMGISTYKSALVRSDLTNCKKLLPNTTLIYDLNYMELMEEKRVFNFNFRQNQYLYDNWCNAFIEAVRKRVDNNNYPVFVCLSSGYDSGAICCALNVIGKRYYTYTILAKENKKCIKERVRRNAANCNEYKIIDFTKSEFKELNNYIRENAEMHKYDVANGSTDIYRDAASTGMSKICKLASSEKHRIYLSGQGADEITCDYARDGKKIYDHSCFAGKFPNDLTTIVDNDPKKNVIWKSFYGGTQKDYLGKEENISGLFGIEGRYPFLDKYVVQAFLALSPKLKKKFYKAPIDYFLRKYRYPYDKGQKIGFSADVNLK